MEVEVERPVLERGWGSVPKGRFSAEVSQLINVGEGVGGKIVVSGEGLGGSLGMEFGLSGLTPGAEGTGDGVSLGASGEGQSVSGRLVREASSGVEELQDV
ncbi:hypothetical protein C0989_004397 [Termitomyces sp. Mn162]|nr:hypothetical protein C0989_004397 [Termitomyces sp. Mn162]